MGSQTRAIQCTGQGVSIGQALDLLVRIAQRDHVVNDAVQQFVIEMTALQIILRTQLPQSPLGRLAGLAEQHDYRYADGLLLRQPEQIVGFRRLCHDDRID